MTNDRNPLVFRWSLYRDVLTFKRDLSLGAAPTWLLIKPWRRTG